MIGDRGEVAQETGAGFFCGIGRSGNTSAGGIKGGYGTSMGRVAWTTP